MCLDYGSPALMDATAGHSGFAVPVRRCNPSAIMMAMRVRLILILAASAALLGCGDHKPPAAGSASPPPATTAPHPVPPAVVPDNRPVIAAFGDSLTAGLGLEPGQSFPDLLQRQIDAAGYRYHVVNLGVSGDTTTDGIERLPTVLSLRPAIVVLEFGANDGLRGQPVTVTRKNLTLLIEAFRNAHADVLLAGMTLPRNYGPDYIQSFEQIYPDLAKQYKLQRIPFLLDGVGGHLDLTQPDGLHPTAPGTEIVARNVMKYLIPMLQREDQYKRLQ